MTTKFASKFDLNVWICLCHDNQSDDPSTNTVSGQEMNLALRWGEETGQMNSTCRGEGEGLNCKTRRQETLRVNSLQRQAVQRQAGRG